MWAVVMMAMEGMVAVMMDTPILEEALKVALTAMSPQVASLPMHRW
jgi:hypothetical protein